MWGEARGWSRRGVDWGNVGRARVRRPCAGARIFRGGPRLPPGRGWFLSGVQEDEENPVVCNPQAGSGWAWSGIVTECAGYGFYWFCCTTRIIPGRRTATLPLLRLRAATVVLYV